MAEAAPSDFPPSCRLPDLGTLTLEAGSRLGSHQIFSRLGKGGMGEVYRTRDSKLGREVTIKVLRRR